MAELQVPLFRSEKLRVSHEGRNAKVQLLDLKPILQNALELRPNTNIVGGSLEQDFKISSKIVSIGIKVGGFLR